MKKCCVDELTKMQDIVAACDSLRIVVAASPFILLLGSLDDPPKERVIDQLQEIIVDFAVNQVIRNAKLPDVAVAINAIAPLQRERLKTVATLHALRHNSEPEQRFWAEMAKVYAR